jgi:putative flippase GtrA
VGAASTPRRGDGRAVRAGVPGGARARAIARRLGARHPLAVQLARYAVIGGGATALNAALFLLVRPWLDAVPANLVALVLTTAVSTEANRRFAFGGARAHRLREWVQDVGTVAFYATYTSTVLIGLEWILVRPTPAEEATAVALASVAGGLLRFAVLRFWVFDVHGGRAGDPIHHPEGAEECSASSPPST